MEFSNIALSIHDDPRAQEADFRNDVSSHMHRAFLASQAVRHEDKHSGANRYQDNGI